MPKDAEYILEDIVDKYSLSEVLGMLADICDGKGEHLESNWQDRVSAKFWYKASKVCAAAADKAFSGAASLCVRS